MAMTSSKNVTFQEDIDEVAPAATVEFKPRPRCAPQQVPRTPSAWYTPERYILGRTIGSGVYASVCEAHDTKQGKDVAIKRCKNLFDNLSDCKRILRELSILQALDHDCVVRLHDAFVPPPNDELCEAGFAMNEIYMVMELCDTDMKRLLKSDVSLEATHVSLLMYNMCCGIKYLHSAGIYHRDMKPANCLVNQDCSVKIADFNLSRAVCGLDADEDENPTSAPMPRRGGTQQRQLTWHVVSRWYRAPEIILLQRAYTDAVDIWSIGCIFAELLEMIEGGPQAQERGPLFPGRRCYPLSPRQNSASPEDDDLKEDQLDYIIDCVGSPSETLVANLDREDARRYLQLFPKRKGEGFKARFPYVEDDALDLLEKTLRFDPADRMKVDEALGHPFLAQVRDPGLETEAPAHIDLSFEKGKCGQAEYLEAHYLNLIRRVSGAGA